MRSVERCQFQLSPEHKILKAELLRYPILSGQNLTSVDSTSCEWLLVFVLAVAQTSAA